MRIYVCIKQVPDTETRIKLAGSGIDETGVKWVINPYDEFAVEEGIRFKEAFPAAQVTAITLGPKARVNNALLTAMAMGADDSILIDAPESLDAFTTAKALAEAIKKEGAFHIIYGGKQAIDDSVSAVGPMLAEFLNIPHSSSVIKCDYSTGDKVVVQREAEGGSLETFELPIPALIAANKGLNKPRFASLPGIMKAKKKPIKEFTLADLGLSDAKAKIKYTQYELPKDRPACKMIGGEPAQQAKELVRLLREEAKVL